MFIIHTSEFDGIPIKVVRDDLYPFLGGGNKGRKMDYVAREIAASGAAAVVTTGGIQSNHCRAVAIYSAQSGLKCKLVLHGSEADFYRQSGNAKIIRDCGVEVVFAKHSGEIGDLMDDATLSYKNQGLKPYYLYGGGHTLEGGLAYIDAVRDLRVHCDLMEWKPDFIFHASGTGSTQAGILAGLDKFQFENTKVIGISVGRERGRAEISVKEFYHKLCRTYGIHSNDRSVTVLDDYLCGGYGQTNEEVRQISQASLRTFGFVLDCTYTAKAFNGMIQYIKKHQISRSNILFWHTGGLLNYLAD